MFEDDVEQHSFDCDNTVVHCVLSLHAGWGADSEYEQGEMRVSVDVQSISCDYLDKEGLQNLIKLIEQKENYFDE